MQVRKRLPLVKLSVYNVENIPTRHIYDI